MRLTPKRLGIATAAIAATIALAVVPFLISPWPGALLIRWMFDRGAAEASQRLERHVPRTVTDRLDIPYASPDPDATLDVFLPARDQVDPRTPTVVWIHGGAWVSGSKGLIANYLRVLAGKGFGVVGVGYGIAPEHRYPAAVRQIQRALTYLDDNAHQLGLTDAGFVLAGDSAGAQLAAQIASLITVPKPSSWANTDRIERTRLRGVLLYCGVFDALGANFDGTFGPFLRTVLWAYTGERDFSALPAVNEISVLRHVTAEFPPAFISAGNADPLLPQSVAFSQALKAASVEVETLFFPDAHQPPLAHEYQFDLDSSAGQLALERSLRFLNRIATTPGPGVGR